MAPFWFFLALVLLVVAVVLLRLDAKKRGGGGPVAGAGDRARVEPAESAESVEPVEPTDPTELSGPTDPAESPAEPPAGELPTEEITAEASPLDPTEPTVESSPRLLDKVRAILPARRQNSRVPEPVEQPQEDPLAGSPVVRWLEDRAFEPTQTPAPEFRHGDFAVGLSALGTVSHGMFRGRRAIMGVTGGRTVLALRRDTASDVVLDLSRPDVDVEPGFHDAGLISTLEARTSDYGRLDLIDRPRLVDAVGAVPAEVRRLWAEGEWVAATIDGADDPSTWDDVVMSLHGAADVLAPLPPIGGRARALPAEIDPGAPGAADGPDADPTVGMDGEVGTGTHGIPHVSVGGGSVTTAPAAAPPQAGPEAGESTGGPAAADPGGEEPADDDAPAVSEPRRSGHLRLVPDRSAARDLTDVPVVADRGDSATEQAPVEPEPEPEPESAEPDPFAEIMDLAGPVESRGDVAADFLPPRPPLSRPTRGVGHTYPEDASVPPLAAGVSTSGSAEIKPLGSEDDDDEIVEEVKRFDAARIDGRSDLDDDSNSRGRHRRDDDDEESRAGKETDGTELSRSGRERPGVEPDVEQTTRLELPDFEDRPDSQS